MRKWLLAGVVLAALAVVAVVAVRMFMPPPDDLDLARSKPSDGGTYVVSVEPEAEPVERGELHAWIVTVALPDGTAVADADLTVDGGMPQHGHGLPTAPASAGHIGEGRYRVEGVRFNMGGWWVLKFDISSPTGDDTAEFNIVL